MTPDLVITKGRLVTLNEQAAYYHECFVSLVGAGFTEEQALQLVCAHMHGNTVRLNAN